MEKKEDLDAVIFCHLGVMLLHVGPQFPWSVEHLVTGTAGVFLLLGLDPLDPLVDDSLVTSEVVSLSKTGLTEATDMEPNLVMDIMNVPG